MGASVERAGSRNIAIYCHQRDRLAILSGRPLCTRFRDIAQIVSTVLQVAFFVTPVIWKPEFLPPQAHYLVSYNPFAPLLAVVRDPLLSRPLPSGVWLTACGIVLGTSACVLPFVGRFCRRLIYWL
jgi:ABC-type polysaccharide/polyol phosphate export permease